jgi:hypothetical protein
MKFFFMGFALLAIELGLLAYLYKTIARAWKTNKWETWLGDWTRTRNPALYWTGIIIANSITLECFYGIYLAARIIITSFGQPKF